MSYVADYKGLVAQLSTRNYLRVMDQSNSDSVVHSFRICIVVLSFFCHLVLITLLNTFV
jgi:hypothetical protein